VAAGSSLTICGIRWGRIDPQLLTQVYEAPLVVEVRDAGKGTIVGARCRPARAGSPNRRQEELSMPTLTAPKLVSSRDQARELTAELARRAASNRQVADRLEIDPPLDAG
jgi:hypothetical protein